jgi:eukaryotic-like serine/threonine-protein kinase
MPGWCNGSAGFVFLWTSAARILGESEWMELAEGAAWDTYLNPDPVPNLCCGLAGRGYALLNMHRATREAAWLERAAQLGARLNHRESLGSASLYKGDAGPALFAAELHMPESAAMPLFELERWREATAQRIV